MFSRHLKSPGVGYVAASPDPAVPIPRGDEALTGPLLLTRSTEHLTGSAEKCLVGGLFASALSLNKQAQDTG